MHRLLERLGRCWHLPRHAEVPLRLPAPPRHLALTAAVCALSPACSAAFRRRWRWRRTPATRAKPSATPSSCSASSSPSACSSTCCCAARRRASELSAPCRHRHERWPTLPTSDPRGEWKAAVRRRRAADVQRHTGTSGPPCEPVVVTQRSTLFACMRSVLLAEKIPRPSVIAARVKKKKSKTENGGCWKRRVKQKMVGAGWDATERRRCGWVGGQPKASPPHTHHPRW